MTTGLQMFSGAIVLGAAAVATGEFARFSTRRGHPRVVVRLRLPHDLRQPDRVHGLRLGPPTRSTAGDRDVRVREPGRRGHPRDAVLSEPLTPRTLVAGAVIVVRGRADHHRPEPDAVRRQGAHRGDGAGRAAGAGSVAGRRRPVVAGGCAPGPIQSSIGTAAPGPLSAALALAYVAQRGGGVQTAIDIGAGTPSSTHSGPAAAAADPAAFPVDRRRSAEPVASPVLGFLERLHGDLASMTAGSVASYIPELARADPTLFGIAIATVDGALYEVGDTRRPFTLQSISKPLTYALALDDLGEPEVRDRIGVEPTGDAFNSISLAPARGTPLNPMVNAGAIAAAALVAERDEPTGCERILATYSRLRRPIAGRRRGGLPLRARAPATATARSPTCSATSDVARRRRRRRRSTSTSANARSWSTCRDLARDGRDARQRRRQPAHRASGSPIARTASARAERDGDLRHVRLRRASGCTTVGLPAKSGVAGGVLAVLPGQLGIARVLAARSTRAATASRGVAVCRELAASLGLHLLSSGRTGGPVVRTRRDLTTARSARARTASGLGEHRPADPPGKGHDRDHRVHPEARREQRAVGDVEPGGRRVARHVAVGRGPTGRRGGPVVAAHPDRAHLVGRGDGAAIRPRSRTPRARASKRRSAAPRPPDRNRGGRTSRARPDGDDLRAPRPPARGAPSRRGRGAASRRRWSSSR